MEAHCSGEAWTPNFQTYCSCPAALLQTGGSLATTAVHLKFKDSMAATRKLHPVLFSMQCCS